MDIMVGRGRVAQRSIGRDRRRHGKERAVVVIDDEVEHLPRFVRRPRTDRRRPA